jgi:putative multiple sugar transport system ATP-binding protein
MDIHHGGESTGDLAGALASVRGGEATAASESASVPPAALAILRDGRPLLEVPFGTVHAVLGTVSALRHLIARLSGTSPAPRGATRSSGSETVLVDGRPARLSSRAASSASGVAVVTAGQAISWSQTIGENVLLGAERGMGLRETVMRLLRGPSAARTSVGQSDAERIHRALAVVGLDRSPAESAGDLSVVERRLVELARAVAAEASLIVIDDSGPALRADEVERWRQAMVEVTRAPRTAAPAPGVLLATGAVTGLARVASTATVLAVGGGPSPSIRLSAVDGEREVLAALAAAVGGVDAFRPVADGSSTSDHASPIASSVTAPGLAVGHWTASHPADPERTVVDDLSFACAPGEVLGLFGPPDSGAGEVLLSVFGRSYGARTRGTVALDGAVVDVSTTELARAAGVLYTTEHPIRFDLSFLGGVPSSVSPDALTRMVRLGVADPRRDYRATTVPSGLVAALPGVHRGPDADQFTESLRIIADTGARAVLLAEPFGATGAPGSEDGRRRAERCALIRSLAASGRAVVVSSEDPAALAAVCDRVVAVRAGRIVGTVGAVGVADAERLDTRAVIEAMGGLA